jgi:hypothetical protein
MRGQSHPSIKYFLEFNVFDKTFLEMSFQK